MIWHHFEVYLHPLNFHMGPRQKKEPRVQKPELLFFNGSTNHDSTCFFQMTTSHYAFKQHPAPQKKPQRQDSLLATPPFQTDLRSDSCICFLREVSAVLGCIQSGCGTLKSQGTEWINEKAWRIQVDLPFISISLRILDPPSWRAWTRITGVSLGPQNDASFEGPMILLRDSNILMFFLREECWVLGRVLLILLIQIRDQRLLVVCSERNNLPYLVGGFNPS